MRLSPALARGAGISCATKTFLLLVTWLAYNQPASNYQVLFNSNVRVVDANNAIVIRVVAGGLEMLKVIVSELNAKAKKLN